MPVPTAAAVARHETNESSAIRTAPGRQLTDARLLMISRSTRAFAFGFAAVLVGVHLQYRGLSSFEIGLTLGVGVLAAGISGLGFAYIATRSGRRWALALTGVLMALTGLDLAVASSPITLLLAGVTGMLGASGVDAGPFLPVEQAVLTEATSPGERNRAFGRYSLSGGVAGTFGGFASGLATDLTRSQAFFLVFAIVGLLTALVACLLSPSVEHDRRHRPIAWTYRRSVFGLAGLFMLDAGAGGFILPSMVAYWLHVRFGATSGQLGATFGAATALQTLSYEAAWRLADRIGLINTMVWTHLPSLVFPLFIPFSPTLSAAVAFYLANAACASMDVPARQAYLVSIVPHSEREGTLAVTGAARNLSQFFSPVLSGMAVQFAVKAAPFVACAALKFVYLGLLYSRFRHTWGEHEAVRIGAGPGRRGES